MKTELFIGHGRVASELVMRPYDRKVTPEVVLFPFFPQRRELWYQPTDRPNSRGYFIQLVPSENEARDWSHDTIVILEEHIVPGAEFKGPIWYNMWYKMLSVHGETYSNDTYFKGERSIVGINFPDFNSAQTQLAPSNFLKHQHLFMLKASMYQDLLQTFQSAVS